MSEEIKIVLPKLGESIHSATIVQWFKKIGDAVQLDEPLLEVSTDKVNSEIPSPVAGVLRAIHAHPDQELQVGDLLAVVASGAAAAPQAVQPGAPTPSISSGEQPSGSGEMSDFFSPALLRLAREKGIALDELEKISGTGAGGRLTKKDLELYIEKKGASCKPCPAMASKTPAMPTSAAISAEIERLKMTGMRKAIAD
ncbi:MAG: E3 binding domain-containing protein, partial [Verrucomicrobia bacterium]|nr:E3 binding domain-containing protein [Verrucomicrobiota bacterium]